MIWSRTGHDKWQVQHVLATSMAFWINLMSSDAVQRLSTMARQSFFWCFCVCLAMEDLTDSTAQGETWCLAVIDFKKEMCEAWISPVLQCFLREQWETSPKDGRCLPFEWLFNRSSWSWPIFGRKKERLSTDVCRTSWIHTRVAHQLVGARALLSEKAFWSYLDHGSLNLRPELSLGNSPIQNLHWWHHSFCCLYH